MSAGGADESADGLIEEIMRAPVPPEPGDTSELLTFLIADIRGYTTFTNDRGDEAAARLTTKFAAVVRELIVPFDGSVFELRGDEALCVFRSPRQSLRFAVALQQRFVDEMRDEPDLPLAVGIGVDAGEAVRGEDGYRGGALNLAARLCSQAKPGEVLATTEVTHLARRIDGLRYVPGESLALKGLAAPVRPVRVLPDDADPSEQIAALRAPAPPVGTNGPAARGRRSTPRRLTVAAAVVVAAVVASVLLAERGGGGGGGRALRAFGENSAGVVDPGSGRLVAQVAVDLAPNAVVAGLGAAWTANTGGNSVSRIDPATRRVTQTVQVGSAPSAVVTGLGAVWVANSGSGTVSRIDPASNAVQSIAVGSAPGGLAVAAGAVWVANTGDGTVSRIDPARNAVTKTIAVGDSPSGIAGAGRSDVWVANSASNTVSEIDPAGNAVTQTIHVGNDPRGIVLVGGDVWVSDNLDGTVAHIPAGGSAVTDTVQVGQQPTALAEAGGHLWVAVQAGESVAEIDTTAARRIKVVPLGVTPTALGDVSGRLWVTTSIAASRHVGGTIRLLGQDPGSIDPVYYGNPWTLWLLNDSYDALVGYRHANGAESTDLVPDLAAGVPSPTNGGRTYTFRLRSGIRWSTGAPVTVDDVQRGIERLIASGFSGLSQEIAGAASCSLKRCALPGVAVDRTAATVTITLNRPSGEFLDQLALAVAAPAATPLGDHGRSPIPATGPYRIASDNGRVVVLGRNRYFHEWSAAAQPAGFPDRIEWRVDPHGDDTKAATAAVAQGQADWADARGADTLAQLQSRFGARLYVTPTETSHGIALNTRVAPFDDVRVRRALAYAVDRQAVADAWFTPALPTCQVLPPNFPGYRPYCPYTLPSRQPGAWRAPDYPTAQRLVEESHTKGMTITVWSPPSVAAGMRPVVEALNQLGYHARLAVYTKASPAYFSFIADSRTKFQAGFGGWVASVPNASDFMVSQYECRQFSPADPNNPNFDEFCDPTVDRLIAQAQQVGASAPADANRLWAEADRRVVDAAPWIGLVTPSWVDAVSSRVHNYVRSSVLGVFFDQMWVR